MAYYLGRRRQGDLILFHSAGPPTKESHGQRFLSVIGPFKSRLGARYYARYGQDNPAVKTAEDAERWVRADPRMEQIRIEERLSERDLAVAQECAADDQFEYSPNPKQTGAMQCPIKLNINA